MAQHTQVTVQAGPLAGRAMLVTPQSAMAAGRFEQAMFEALAPLDLSGEVVWDVGGWIGYSALVFATLVGPTGRVVTFEPNPANVSRMRSNFAINDDLAPRITVIEAALAGTDGEAAFVFSAKVDSGESSGSHLAEAIAPEDAQVYAGFQGGLVTTARIDTMARTLPAPALIKIDVEGAEHLVLEGGQAVLAGSGPMLLIEIHGPDSERRVRTVLDILHYRTEVVSVEDKVKGRCHLLAVKPST